MTTTHEPFNAEPRHDVLQRLEPDTADITTLHETTLPMNPYSGTRVALERIDALDEHAEPVPVVYSVLFQPSGRDYAEIDPSSIPALIDALREMYRCWLIDSNGIDGGN